MKRLPYFKWYPADAESDENFRVLTDEELGFYMRCLNHAWVNQGLPIDLEEIARALRTPVDIVTRHWVRVGKCFSLVNGRYFNQRQEDERVAAMVKSEKSRAAVQTRYESSTSVERPKGSRSDSVALRAYASASTSGSASESSQKRKSDFEEFSNSEPSDAIDRTTNELCKLHAAAGIRAGEVSAAAFTIAKFVKDAVNPDAILAAMVAAHPAFVAVDWHPRRARSPGCSLPSVAQWIASGEWRHPPAIIAPEATLGPKKPLTGGHAQMAKMMKEIEDAKARGCGKAGSETVGA